MIMHMYNDNVFRGYRAYRVGFSTCGTQHNLNAEVGTE